MDDALLPAAWFRKYCCDHDSAGDDFWTTKHHELERPMAQDNVASIVDRSKFTANNAGWYAGNERPR